MNNWWTVLNFHSIIDILYSFGLTAFSSSVSISTRLKTRHSSAVLLRPSHPVRCLRGFFSIYNFLTAKFQTSMKLLLFFWYVEQKVGGVIKKFVVIFFSSWYLAFFLNVYFLFAGLMADFFICNAWDNCWWIVC